MSLEPCYTVCYGRPGAEDPLLVMSRKGQVFLRDAGNGLLIVPEAAAFPTLSRREAALLGKLSGRRCYGVFASGEEAVPPGLRCCELREAFVRTAPAEYRLLLRGKAMLEWLHARRYCGVCGEPLANSEQEEARVCPRCGTAFFPKISPAVIVGVLRGEEILLAHNRKFRDNIHSFIAGFVEPGESVEAAVARELAEEVGIRVNNIRYWGSQSWPFPDSLMLGFAADYESGEIRPDGEEIESAAFFRRDGLPPIPRPGSIARRMIEAWLKGNF